MSNTLITTAKRLVEFCIAMSLSAAVTSFLIGNTSAGIGYANATFYAICWRLSIENKTENEK